MFKVRVKDINGKDRLVDASVLISGSYPDLQDAIDKRHTQNTDTFLDFGGANEISAAQAKAAFVHTSNTNNPHNVTKAQIGLGNADNTSDANKPISSAAQAAFNLKADKSTTINGYSLANNISLAKSDIGLGNVDNTSDATKFAAIATLTNKTISGASNTFSNIPFSALNSLAPSSIPFAGADGKLTVDSTFFFNSTTKTINSSNGNFTGQVITPIIYGSTAPGGNIVIASTTDATKGFIYFGAAQSSGFDGANNRLGILTNAPTHSITLAMASTGIVAYNTTDQTTNYERVRMYWSGNVFLMSNEVAGTGANRQFTFAPGSTTLQILHPSNQVIGSIIASKTTATAGTGVAGIGGTLSQSTGTGFSQVVYTNISQTGTAGYNAHLITVFENTLGTGQKWLANYGTNSAGNNAGTHTQKFGVRNDGLTFLANIAAAPSAPSGGIYLYARNGTGYVMGTSGIETPI